METDKGIDTEIAQLEQMTKKNLIISCPFYLDSHVDDNAPHAHWGFK